MSQGAQSVKEPISSTKLQTKVKKTYKISKLNRKTKRRVRKFQTICINTCVIVDKNSYSRANYTIEQRITTFRSKDKQFQSQKVQQTLQKEENSIMQKIQSQESGKINEQNLHQIPFFLFNGYQSYQILNIIPFIPNNNIFPTIGGLY